VGKGGFNLVKKLGGWLLKDEVPDAFSDEEIQDLADALDAQPEEVRVLLQDEMDADEDDDEG
jgi:Glu-tRNA(Gln) amidotransferase subunit E-like FAD-binding protein